MPEFMMIMKSDEHGGNAADWAQYIELLSNSGLFRGGSALGNGVCVSQNEQSDQCVVSGFMRFEADAIDQVLALVPGNPVIKSGGEVEVLELLKT
jgi:hypothetical protein